jgi:hypothetical protein
VLTPELLNLNGIVVEMQTMLRPLIGEDVLLTTQLDPALGPIEADPGQLHQVVMNLVVNARDAMPNGGSLTIETANADVDEIGDGSIEPGRYITLTVRDAGEGIDEETLGQIFEPFFTTKDASKGTGLGLATVYGIVKQSGGYVEVESEVGVGSAFRIYLRRVDDSGIASEPPVIAVAPTASVSQSVKRVLVVEDEEVVRGLVQADARGPGLRGPRRRGRREGARHGRTKHDRRAAHRSDDAECRRTRGRRAAARVAARSEGHLHVGVRRGPPTGRCRPRPRSSESRSPSRS